MRRIKGMPFVFAIVATLAGMGASLMFLTLLMAGGANSTPEQIARIKAWMLATALVALGGVVAAVWMMIMKRPWVAAGAGAVPVAFCVVSVAWLVWTSGP